MIKVKTSKGTTRYDFKGDIPEIAADLMVIIKTICQNVSVKNPEDAAALVQFIAQELDNPDFLAEVE